jgi:hypothetical protein
VPESKLPSNNQAHSSKIAKNVYFLGIMLLQLSPAYYAHRSLSQTLPKSDLFKSRQKTASTFKTQGLLRLLRLSRFGGFFAIAPHHDDAQETAHDGAAQQQQDDGDADGPDAGREEGLDRVRVVDEGLCWVLEI